MNCFAGWQIDWGKFAEIGATSIATLAAAYFGAKFAFDMQIRREMTKQVATNVDNANLAIFTVRRFRGLFQSLLKSIETPEHHFDDHYLLMKPFSTLNVDGPSFSYDSLSFLLKAKEEVLFKLSDLQHSIAATLELVKQRSELHFNIVQPAIEALQKEHDLVVAPDNFPELVAEKIGPRVDAIMELLTKEMISGLNADAEQCTLVANELAEAVEQAHPTGVKRRLWSSRSSA